jgi:hypothetical protein
MSIDISDAFIRQYEAEVHEAYQRMGSKLRNTVRQKNGITGESTTFQKVGKGEASQKTRHGDVPVMNVDHTPVLCPLNDWYAGDFVDKLDELKFTIDERKVISNAGAFALGRKTDTMILEDGLSNGTNQVAATVQDDRTTGASTGMNVGKVLEAITALGNRDVTMEDGGLTLVVGWNQWTELMSFDQFSRAEYVGPDDLPWKGKGFSAKFWNGLMVFPHSGLPVTAGDIRSCFAYHRTAIGHATGAEVSVDITWQGTKAAHFINNSMSQGSCLIDDDGVQEILCDESP